MIVSGLINGGMLINVVSHIPFTHFTTQVVIVSLWAIVGVNVIQPAASGPEIAPWAASLAFNPQF